MTAAVLRADASTLPLADNSVDLIVTSPPYWALRSYQDGGEHYAGQLGSEPTPAEFVDALIETTREMVRVLKPSGSLWINLGDKYAGQSRGRFGVGLRGDEQMKQGARKGHRRSRPRAVEGVPGKSLMGIPWRYALRCIDDLGLILRAEVIWSKPNGLPESVTDRVRRSHEQWFHMVRQPRYYSAVDEIREAQQSTGERHNGRSGYVNAAGKAGGEGVARSFTERALHPLGKLPGSVWTIPTQPLTVPAYLGIDHFAAFPMEWPRRIIRGWSPPGICTACGEGRRPVAGKRLNVDHIQRRTRGRMDLNDDGSGRRADSSFGITERSVVGSYETTITGYSCACPDTTARTRPAVVLDPFGGTGTTALVAHALGRHGISVDLSADYCRLARWRTTDEGQYARATRVRKPKRPKQQTDGQLSLLDLPELGGPTPRRTAQNAPEREQ